MDKNGAHSTFGFIEEDFDYDELKSYVTKILEKQVEPTATSTKKTKN